MEPEMNAYAVCIDGCQTAFERVVAQLGGRIAGDLPWYCGGHLLVILPASAVLSNTVVCSLSSVCALTQVELIH